MRKLVMLLALLVVLLVPMVVQAQTTMHLSSVMAILLLFHLLGLRLGLLDRADVHEGLLGQVVPLAVGNLLEAANRVG